MAQLKTRPTGEDVEGFLAAVANDQRREDAKVVCQLMADITGESPAMWGTSIVGFSPRKAALTIYLDGFDNRADVLARLGKHSIGKGCLYIKQLDQVDQGVLRELIADSVASAVGIDD